MVADIPIAGSVTVESKPAESSKVWELILSEVEANDYSQEDVFAVHLAMEEAFINAIKHGNKMDPGKKVQVDYLVTPKKIEITVTDEGEGFTPDLVPDPRSGKQLHRAEGRGLLLIYSYMDEIEYNERGNSVRMVRFKEKPRIGG